MPCVWRRIYLYIYICIYTLSATVALQLNVNDPASIKSVAGLVAKNLVSLYNESHSGSAYDWSADGVFLGTMLDYWRYTGDTQYNSLITQLGSSHSPPRNNNISNDDQGLWALAAMTAVEAQFPAITDTGSSWLDSATNTFEDLAGRWDTQSCGGGLHWQIAARGGSSAADYKNAISQAVLFQLAARLARYTGNQTYASWASKTWDWTASVGLIAPGSIVYDGTSTSDNCSEITKLQWTYDSGAFLYGSAVMHNISDSDKQWQNRTQGLLSAMSRYFFSGGDETSSVAPSQPSDVMIEPACEYVDSGGTCRMDQYFFKGLAAQWMGATMLMAPFTKDFISTRLRSSAIGAARQCDGEDDGVLCAAQWTNSKSNRNTGFEQQLSTLSVILATLAINGTAPVTANNTIATTINAATSSTNAAASPTSGAVPFWVERGLPTRTLLGAGIVLGLVLS